MGSNYDREYFDRHELYRRDYLLLSGYLVDLFRPTTAIDFGCGNGALLHSLSLRGVIGHGIDSSEAGLDAAHAAARRASVADRRLLTWQQADLTSKVVPPLMADLGISIEVAEHLPTEFSRQFVSLICLNTRNFVVFSAAKPGQPGEGHQNLQYQEFWIDLFSKFNFRYMKLTSEGIRRVFRTFYEAYWLRDNLMIFRR